MNLKLRPGTPEDAGACGRICYDAFAAVAAAHGHPRDLLSPEVATGLVTALLGPPGIFSVVAEAGGGGGGADLPRRGGGPPGGGAPPPAPAGRERAGGGPPIE